MGELTVSFDSCKNLSINAVLADIDAHDEYGKTPLHCAVGAQKLDIVQCLLRYKPEVDAHDDRDDTPLHTATRTGNVEIVLVSDPCFSVFQ